MVGDGAKGVQRGDVTDLCDTWSNGLEDSVEVAFHAWPIVGVRAVDDEGDMVPASGVEALRGLKPASPGGQPQVGAVVTAVGHLEVGHLAASAGESPAKNVSAGGAFRDAHPEGNGARSGTANTAPGGLESLVAIGKGKAIRP